MLNINLFQNLTVLYVEDEDSIRVSLNSTFQKIFKKVYIAIDGREALHIFEKLYSENITIDLVICDINMPNMDGIELVEQIKKINPKIEVIMTTARTDSNILVEAIRLGVSHYEIKPVNINKLLENISAVALKYINKQIIDAQQQEMEQYLEILEKVAIVSKTDLEGKITFVNDFFCDVSKFSKEELIGSNHNIIRHPDTPKETFKILWEQINKNKMYKGKLKNKTKDGDYYYVYAYIFPIFDYISLEKKGYIGIRFLITEDENARLDFKKKVIENISLQKKREYDLNNKIKLYETELKQIEFLEFIKHSLEKEKSKNTILLSQVKSYELELKLINDRQREKLKEANEAILSLSGEISQLKVKYESSKESNKKLQVENKNKGSTIASLEIELSKQAKIILDLKDVIEHREEQLLQTQIKEPQK